MFGGKKSSNAPHTLYTYYYIGQKIRVINFPTIASGKIGKNFHILYCNSVTNHLLWLYRFNADTSAAMRWQFRPHQKEIKLVPGETALAFYTARNPTDRPVTGIATYNVIPFEAGLYFNKIQCFCFEEQRLNPREQVHCMCKLHFKDSPLNFNYYPICIINIIWVRMNIMVENIETKLHHFLL